MKKLSDFRKEAEVKARRDYMKSKTDGEKEFYSRKFKALQNQDGKQEKPD